LNTCKRFVAWRSARRTPWAMLRVARERMCVVPATRQCELHPTGPCADLAQRGSERIGTEYSRLVLQTAVSARIPTDIRARRTLTAELGSCFSFPPLVHKPFRKFSAGPPPRRRHRYTRRRIPSSLLDTIIIAERLPPSGGAAPLADRAQRCRARAACRGRGGVRVRARRRLRTGSAAPSTAITRLARLRRKSSTRSRTAPCAAHAVTLAPTAGHGYS
jgi:hypothetical protein